MEQKKNTLNRFLHHNMALIGGFLGGYAIICRADFLGNAQTANLIYLVLSIVGRNPLEVFLRFIALAIYFSAAMLYVFVREKSRFNVKKTSLAIDCAAIIMLGLIPLSVSPIIGLFPIFFAMSFQWNAFPGSYGYNSSTIFSTNNTRQVAVSLAEYLCNGDKMKIHKAVFFLGSIISFHIGVTLSYFATKYLGMYGIWVALIFLIPARIMVYREEVLVSEYSEKTSIKSNVNPAVQSR